MSTHLRYWKKAYFEAIEKFKNTCTAHNLNPIKVAFTWLVHHSRLDASKGDAIIIGASSLEHTRLNLEFCKGLRVMFKCRK
jgi:aflatoxin B1 aldehyde reductase